MPQQKGSMLTLFQVMMGVGSPWALQGIWTSLPDSTVMSLGALVKTGVTEDLKTCINDYSSQDVLASYATNTDIKSHTMWKISLIHTWLWATKNLAIITCFHVVIIRTQIKHANCIYTETVQLLKKNSLSIVSSSLHRNLPFLATATEKKQGTKGCGHPSSLTAFPTTSNLHSGNPKGTETWTQNHMFMKAGITQPHFDVCVNNAYYTENILSCGNYKAMCFPGLSQKPVISLKSWFKTRTERPPHVSLRF